MLGTKILPKHHLNPIYSAPGMSFENLLIIYKFKFYSNEKKKAEMHCGFDHF